MSVIHKVSLLMSRMIRACVDEKSTYAQQVIKYKLNKSEQEELKGLLRDVGYNV